MLLRSLVSMFLAGVILVLTSVILEQGASAARRKSSFFVASQWEDLLPTDSRISLMGENPVTARRMKVDEQRQMYLEAMAIPGGNMLYEVYKGRSGQANEPADAELFKRYSGLGDLKGLGIEINRSAIRIIANSNGQVALTSAESRTHRCTFFLQYVSSDAPEASGQSQVLTGGQCLPIDQPASTQIEARLTNLLERIRFDGGAYARSQIFAAGLESARLESNREDSQIAMDSTPPTIEMVQNIRVDGPNITIQGRAFDNIELADVRVNGKWADVSTDGRFSSRQVVASGSSRIVIVATDTAGNKAERVVTVENVGAGPPPMTPVKQPAAGRYHALIITDQHYFDKSLELDTPIADGRAIGNILEKKYGFNVRYLEDAKKDEIIAAFGDYARSLGSDDRLLVYYAGHGVIDEQSPGKPAYWVPVDGNGSSSANWLPNRQIVRALRRIRAGHLMLISDSCFSGTFTQERDLAASSDGGNLSLHERVDLRSRTALSSGGIERVVDVFRPEDKNSVFAVNLASVLDQNRGTMSGAQISILVRGMVRRQVSQTPQYGAVLSAGHDDNSDFFFFSRN